MREGLPRMDGQHRAAAELRARDDDGFERPQYSGEAALSFLTNFAPFQRLDENARALGDTALSEPAVQIFVRDLSRGSRGFTRMVCVKLPWSRAELEAHVANATSIPAGMLCLSFGGKPLNDELPLRLQGIARGSTLDMRTRVWYFLAPPPFPQLQL